MRLPLEHSFAALPPRFYAKVRPTPVRAPKVLFANRALAEELGLDGALVEDGEGAAILAGNVVPEGANPIALAYAGHQFGGFVPQLGDGRAILLGEARTTAGGRVDVQLKGAGRTPFSRGGDGRAALGPVLREALVSEAMHALGIPTTRTLAAVATGEIVAREEPLPGAVLTRIAASHLRVGTFQYHAARDDEDALRALLAYAIDRHDRAAATAERPALAFLEGVMARQMALVAAWIGVGFVHGVMNTDNVSIAGETLDYGPCAFLDRFSATKHFSSIDRQGRYAFLRQPNITLWNLTRLAEALLPLIDGDEGRAVALCEETLERFPAAFDGALVAVFRRKLGLVTEEPGDSELVRELFAALEGAGADFTRFFRALAAGPVHDDVLGTLEAPVAYEGFATRYAARLARDGAAEGRSARMRATNPAYIPRNHRVEEALAAAHAGDLGPFHALAKVLARPFDEQPEAAAYAEGPGPEMANYRTFCGT